jgi:hypothetical protein
VDADETKRDVVVNAAVVRGGLRRCVELVDAMEKRHEADLAALEQERDGHEAFKLHYRAENEPLRTAIAEQARRLTVVLAAWDELPETRMDNLWEVQRELVALADEGEK